ncbi:adenosylcobinamide-GDP ribazoletransferase [Paenibacillus protaetiae]|uniref:Adenosylcobinamide-GDP ribazoletransferase n=1 Tax=Paenibacillus protaetiae TaxID=2509456 RepID=A0A4P6EVI6_9BACL|nr:adenosylcobinamide-GDP ribazoletransferase [Paenibacillus protaetiae]QAY65689.1 adenosylcobinamide-GDP ribazoletransferase [Paenibacillus protaetiae]
MGTWTIKIKGHVQAGVAAMQFLTRFPIPITVPFEAQTLARSVIYFPLAGLAIGAVTAAAFSLLALLLPAWPAAVLALAVWIALSGGLHLDGWMDTADGVLSHRSREKMLEIMKDSRVGAMGVIAAVLLLLFKFSLLAEYAQGDEGLTFGRLALLAAVPVWSRWWMSAAIAGFPNARQGEGMGALFHAVRPRHVIGGGLGAAAMTAVICAAAQWSWAETAALTAGAVCLSAAAGYAGARWLTRRLGGLTGDTYGALNELVEAVLLAAVYYAAF